jgi:hypothetical protein
LDASTSGSSGSEKSVAGGGGGAGIGKEGEGDEAGRWEFSLESEADSNLLSAASEKDRCAFFLFFFVGSFGLVLSFFFCTGEEGCRRS